MPTHTNSLLISWIPFPSTGDDFPFSLAPSKHFVLSSASIKVISLALPNHLQCLQGIVLVSSVVFPDVFSTFPLLSNVCAPHAVALKLNLWWFLSYHAIISLRIFDYPLSFTYNALISSYYPRTTYTFKSLLEKFYVSIKALKSYNLTYILAAKIKFQ